MAIIVPNGHELFTEYYNVTCIYAFYFLSKTYVR